MSNHVMLDLETMSSDSYAAIVAIGAVKFDPDKPFNPREADTFYQTVSLESSMKAGLRADAKTIMWWLNRSQEARDALLRQEPCQLDEALLGFARWYGDDDSVPVWGNGATFDNVILGNAYKALGMERPWSYRADRCYRTMLAVKPPVDKVEFGTAHNALDDAIAQTLTLLKIANYRGITL